MLAHLSSTSPYVCDLNRGPIEPANRMASTPSRKVSVLLEKKERSSKQTRTPLKLLSPDEVPMDTTATAMDIDASLQPVWYSEKTIADDQSKALIEEEDEDDVAAIIREQQRNSSMYQTTMADSTLPVLESAHPSLIEDIERPRQASLMHKSSTFTIEPEPSLFEDSPMNDSEKENDTLDNGTNHVIAPSDDSFRALEHLLGLGSTATVRESPKNNHDTLSLTVVTPTDIINATSASLRTSFVPKSGTDSQPSSQSIPPMPTIESMDSTIPPSFLADNTAMDDEHASALEQRPSLEMNENETMKDDSNTDEETDFSFELNDFPNDSKDESAIPEPVVPTPQPTMVLRAPTCADVAYRALIKSRLGGRVSQPVKVDSPLAKTNKARSSAPTSRLLRSSCRRASTEASAPNPIVEDAPTNADCLIDESQPQRSALIQVETVPEEDEEEPANGITLNLTATNQSRVSVQPEKAMKPMPSLLSREYTYNSPKPRSSQRRRTALNQTPSILVDQSTSTEAGESEDSMAIPSQSMLGVLLTTANETTPATPSKSMLGILLTTASEATPVANMTTQLLSPRNTRQSDRVSSRSTARASINPLHSSTPSSKRHSLQMVSIGEQEQVSINVPQPSPIEEEEQQQEEEVEVVPEGVMEEEEAEEEELQIDMVPLNDTVPVPIVRTMDIGIQTTPSLDAASRRQLNMVEREMTPIQTNAIIQLQRNVRFQLTPTTDARLAEKEKLDEHLRGLKPEIVFPVTPVQPEVQPKAVASRVKATKTKKKSEPKKKSARTPSPKTKAVEKVEPKKKSARTPSPKTKAVEKPEPVVAVAKRIKKKTVPVTPEPTAAATKRAPRKRSNAKTVEAVAPPPVEPVVKRAKTTKTTVPSRPPSTDAPRTRSRSTTKTVEPVMNTKVSTVRQGKRRLPSSERPKTTGEEEKPQPNPSVEINDEDRKKIEELTVAALKSRLTAHQIAIPKAAKKAELVTLVINTEISLLQEQKKEPVVADVPTAAKRSRRQRK